MILARAKRGNVNQGELRGRVTPSRMATNQVEGDGLDRKLAKC